MHRRGDGDQGSGICGLPRVPAACRCQLTSSMAPRFPRKPCRNPIIRARGPTSWMLPRKQGLGTRQEPRLLHMLVCIKVYSILPASFHHELIARHCFPHDFAPVLLPPDARCRESGYPRLCPCLPQFPQPRPIAIPRAAVPRREMSGFLPPLSPIMKGGALRKYQGETIICAA
jgi:hypothetical protein